MTPLSASDRAPDPCALVIFGATGDLTRRKLLPAYPFSVGQIDRIAVRGQYRAGDASGDIAYLDEPGVAPDSRTGTFAAVAFTLDNWRWQEVPFYVRTGKRLARRASAVSLQFRQPPHLIYGDHAVTPSRLTVRIQPEEGISLSFSGKLPGPDVKLGAVEMEFSYADTFGGRTPEAYEALRLDCFLGDGTLFASNDWSEKSWELLMPILEAWGAPSAAQVPTYDAGSWGPRQADRLFDCDWRKWWAL